ncbi:7016_t:CDS:2 [Funneliformis mosseae]|uniref:7016_t:CDS:1 n=1 Tax=Funneliformis mosseae TaxID=27381 RepID=A0A9N8YYA6_FUNMO|nr:7016_t:CDS:2 [Funneliformis mosseae]
MLTLLTAELEHAVNQLFDDIQAIEESAEAAHALCNCRGRDLKLLTAILQ